MDSSTVDEREAIRAAALHRHNLDEGALFDRKRPTSRFSVRQPASSAEEVALADDSDWWDADWYATHWAEVLLETLTDREGQVIALRYGLGHEPAHTQQECAERMNVSRPRIAALEDSGLTKLRARFSPTPEPVRV